MLTKEFFAGRKGRDSIVLDLFEYKPTLWSNSSAFGQYTFKLGFSMVLVLTKVGTTSMSLLLFFYHSVVVISNAAYYYSESQYKKVPGKWKNDSV